MKTEPSKEEILNNLTVNNNVKVKFMRDYNVTSEQCYDIVYADKDNKCEYCVDKCVFINFNKGYRKVCGNRPCINLLRAKRTTATNLAKYGVENISQLQSIKERKLKSSIKTNLERYGVENVFKSKEIMYKDGIHVTRLPEANLQRTQTMVDRHGTDDPLSLKNGRERGLFKCNYDQTIQEKRIRTNLERYGVENTFKSSLVQDKVMITKNEVGEDGLTSHQRIHYNKMMDICEEGYNSYERVRINRLSDIDEDGYNSYERAKILQKETNEASGFWITEESVEDFRTYSSLCWRYTRNQPIHLLENIEKRGHANKGMFHLDHKYSIFEGFKNEIPAKVIGSIYNLEMVIGRNNISKGRKCSISLEELKELYYDKGI